MWNFKLDETSYKLYAISCYSNGKSTWNEFFNDMKIFNMIFKSLSTYNNTSSLNSINITLNYIIQLGNVFPKESLGRLLFVLAPVELLSQIKTFLLFLKRLPDSVPEYNLDEIVIDKNLYSALEKI